MVEIVKINGTDYVSSAEAARIMGVTSVYVRHLVLNGKLKSLKIGRNAFINYDELMKFTGQRKIKVK